MPTSVAIDVDVDELQHLARKFGTPLYRYHLPTLKSQISRLRSAFSYPVRLLFATMANDEPEILKHIAAQDVGACVNSIHHLSLALNAGFDPTEIQFTSTGTPLGDMAELQRLKIAANLDSPLQVQQWFELGGSATAGIRINAASLLLTARGRDRIGVDAAGLRDALWQAESLNGVVNGLHIYCGTNLPTANDILPLLFRFFNLAQTIPNLDYVNIGGGVGVDYSHSGDLFNYEFFGTQVSTMATSLSDRLGRKIALFFEPGRSMVAQSGIFLTRVTDVKELAGERFVAVDASIALFPRPFHHPDSPHQVRVVGSEPNIGVSPSIIVGRTTFSRDILARCSLPNVNVGDLLVFDDAGAYCRSMSSRFLGQKIPACVVMEA